MPDAPTPRDLADRFLELLRERTATNDADDVRQQFIQNYTQLEAALAEPAARDAVVARLTAFLTSELSDWEFACTANTCGLAVEVGADPGTAVGPILDRLPALLAGAKELADGIQTHFGTPNLEQVPEEKWEEAARQSPEAGEMVRRFLAIAFAGRSAMTMLARRAELRHQARTRADLADAVIAAREVNPYAFYLAELLGSADGEEVIVLDLARELGFLVRLTGVRNNFHFFTLLQDALANHPTAAGWDGPKPSPLLAAVAKGERMVSAVTPDEWSASGMLNADGEVYDRNLWTFYQWPALQPDGSIETAAAAQPHMPWWAWGEMKPGELTDLDGVRLLLLGPPEMPRAWGLGFFSPLHPALRSAVTVEKVLSPESVKGWLADIRAVPRQATDEAAVGTGGERAVG